MRNRPDTDLITKFFNEYVYVKHHCAEVRCFNSQVNFQTSKVVPAEKGRLVVGWFTNANYLACHLERLDGVSAYITVNPVSLARRPKEAENKLLNCRKGFCCDDQDITVIRYIIIDIDPPRVGNNMINSTDKELKDCLDTRDKIIVEIGDSFGFQNAIMPGISGNGAFILIRLSDFEKDEQLNQDIEEFLKYLSDKYKNSCCSIDYQTGNASRHLPIPGTWKYRNLVSTAARPHRQVAINLPSELNNARSIRSEGLASCSS